MSSYSGSFDYQCRVVCLFGVDVMIISHERVLSNWELRRNFGICKGLESMNLSI
jgi:hypothetical protein